MPNVHTDSMWSGVIVEITEPIHFHNTAGRSLIQISDSVKRKDKEVVEEMTINPYAAGG